MKLLKKNLVSLFLLPISAMAGDFFSDAELEKKFSENYSYKYEQMGDKSEQLTIVNVGPQESWSIVHFYNDFLIRKTITKSRMEKISVLCLNIPQMSNVLFEELCTLHNLHTLNIEVKANLGKSMGYPDTELSKKGFDPLKDLKKLTTFSFCINNNFKEYNWDVLEVLELLENLTLVGVKLKSFPSTLKLKNLKSLNLSKNSLEDFLWISDCVNLESLVLNANKITYKKAKKSVKKIKNNLVFKQLELAGNPMTDEELNKISKRVKNKISSIQDLLIERMLQF